MDSSSFLLLLQHQFIPTSLTQFFNTFFLCNNLSTVIFLYDNFTSTTDIARSILLSSTLQQSWITINVDQSANFTSDSDAFIITAFNPNDYIEKFMRSNYEFELRQSCSRIVIWPSTHQDIHQNAAELMVHYDDLDLVNVAFISWSDDELHLLRLMSDSMRSVRVNWFGGATATVLNCWKLHEELFYDKIKDLEGTTVYAYVMIDPPRGINITRYDSLTKRELFSIGGRNAYLSALIPRYVNVTLKYFAVSFAQNRQNTKFFSEYFGRTYVEDRRVPRELAYDLVSLDQIKSFMRQNQVLLSTEQTSEYNEDASTYPHEMDSIVVIVPNIRLVQTSMLTTLLEMPLFSVWAFAIGLFSVSRKAIRKILQKPKNYFFEILIDTFGISFATGGGTASAVLHSRTENLLLLFLSVFSMLASIFCSGILFQQMTSSTSRPAINSLKDLSAHPHLDVKMSWDTDESTLTWLRGR